MNTSAINGGVLGSGSRNPWVLASASQVLAAVCDLSLALTKRGAATCAASVTGTLQALRRTHVTVAGECALAAMVAASVWRRVVTAVAGMMKCVGGATGHAIQYYAGDGALVVAASLTARAWSLIRVPIAGVAAVVGTVTGYDLYSRPAPDSRTFKSSISAARTFTMTRE